MIGLDCQHLFSWSCDGKLPGVKWKSSAARGRHVAIENICQRHFVLWLQITSPATQQTGKGASRHFSRAPLWQEKSGRGPVEMPFAAFSNWGKLKCSGIELQAGASLRSHWLTCVAAASCLWAAACSSSLSRRISASFSCRDACRDAAELPSPCHRKRSKTQWISDAKEKEFNFFYKMIYLALDSATVCVTFASKKKTNPPETEIHLHAVRCAILVWTDRGKQTKCVSKWFRCQRQADNEMILENTN